MSNEELVALVRAGDGEKLLDLWQQVRRMVWKEAARWASYHSNGVELADLEQGAFIGLMRAVDTYDPSAGTKFSTWYHSCMLSEFMVAANRRTEKGRRDPLQAAVSLDVPVGEDEDGTTLGELQADPGAARAMEAVEAREWQTRLHAALEVALATLPPELQGAVRGRYFRGETVNANLHDKAMRLLRHPRVSRPLREFL